MKVRLKFGDLWDYLIPEELVEDFDRDRKEIKETASTIKFDKNYADFKIGKAIEEVPFEVSLEDYVKVCPNYLAKKHEIVVNGKKIVRESSHISFSEVVELAGKETKYNPSVTYSYANKNPSRGIMFWHEGIETKEGTTFSVLYTGNA